MDDQHAKKRRLDSGTLRHAAAGSLQHRSTNSGHVLNVLDHLHDAGLVGELPSQDSVRAVDYRKRAKLLKQVARTVVLPTVDGATHEWTVADPLRLIEFLAQENTGYANLLLRGDILVPGQETPLLIFCDECTPGNALKADVARKAWMYYGALASCKQQLYSPSAWFTLAALSSHTAREIQGGIAAATSGLVLSMLPALQGTTISVGGCLKLAVRGVCGDEAGLAAMWAAKGASGRRSCGCAPSSWGCASRCIGLCRLDGAICSSDEASNRRSSSKPWITSLQSPVTCPATSSRNWKRTWDGDMNLAHHCSFQLPSLRPHLKPSSTVFDTLQLGLW